MIFVVSDRTLGGGEADEDAFNGLVLEEVTGTFPLAGPSQNSPWIFGSVGKAGPVKPPRCTAGSPSADLSHLLRSVRAEKKRIQDVE
jgi:hypothetical protein